MNDSVLRREPRWIIREDNEGHWVLAPYHTSTGLQNDAVLRREQRRIAIESNHRCFGCEFEDHCGTHGCAIIREALEQLEMKEPNDPLPPEALLEMEGDPVFLSGEGLDRWDIFCGTSTDGLACFLRGALPMDGCGKTWVPYRRKP